MKYEVLYVLSVYLQGLSKMEATLWLNDCEEELPYVCINNGHDYTKVGNGKVIPFYYLQPKGCEHIVLH